MKILWLIVFFLLYTTDKEKAEKELNSVKEKIKATEQEREVLKKKEGSILQRLSEISEKIERREKTLQKLKQEERKIKERIEILRKGSSKAQTNLENQKDAMGSKLALLYEYDSSEIDEVYMKYIYSILDENNRKIKEIKTLKDSLVSKRIDFETELAKLENIKRQEKEQKQKLAAEKQEKNTLLKKIREEEKLKTRTLNELKEARRRLEELIAGFVKYPKAQEFGKIEWPVRGTVVLSFGTIEDPEYGTKLVNNGIDIKADINTPVSACADGKVVYAGDFLGYGKIILIDHRNGYHSLYAHLSKILVMKEEDVQIGDVIGEVGDTGSIKGPLLHFEIRKDGKAVNPLDYLK